MVQKYLGIAAVVLIAVVVIGFQLSDPGHQDPAFIAVLAIMVLLELPAVVVRMYGGSALKTWVVAVLLPLVPFELVLAFSPGRNQGGDLQGIEDILMLYVVPPAVLVTASVVTLIATLTIQREDPDY